MKQCPECGGYMTWYCTATGYHGWRCMCGYDTGNVSVTYSTSITISNDSMSELVSGKLGAHLYDMRGEE